MTASLFPSEAEPQLVSADTVGCENTKHGIQKTQAAAHRRGLGVYPCDRGLTGSWLMGKRSKLQIRFLPKVYHFGTIVHLKNQNSDHCKLGAVCASSFMVFAFVNPLHPTFMCHPGTNGPDAFVVTVVLHRRVNRQICAVPTAEVPTGDALPSHFSSRAVNQGPSCGLLSF